MEPPRAASSTGHWELRPGDLPRGRLADLPELRGLAQNPVYRLLLFQAHRQSRNRTLLVVAYLAFWLLLGAPYFRMIGGGTALSILYSSILALMMGIFIALLFWSLGIQGYETNGRLRAYFGDIVQVGAKGSEIAQAVHGSTLSRTDFQRIRLGVAAACAALAASLALLPLLRGFPFLIWLGQTGLCAAAFLFAALGRPEALSLPGSLLWLGGVRRSYERRVAEDEGGLASMLAAGARLCAIVVGLVAVIAFPLALWLLAGIEWTERRYPAGIAPGLAAQRFAIDAAIAALAGLAAGRAWGAFTLWRMPAMLSRLAWEMERLFELRRQWLHERRVS